MKKSVLLMLLCCCFFLSADVAASTPSCDGAFGLKWESSPEETAEIVAKNNWNLVSSSRVPDPDLVPTLMQRYKGNVDDKKANVNLIFDQSGSAPMSLYAISVNFDLDVASQREEHYATMLEKLKEQFGPPTKENPKNATYQMAEWSVPWQNGKAQIILANTQMGYALKYQIHGPRFVR